MSRKESRQLGVTEKAFKEMKNRGKMYVTDEELEEKFSNLKEVLNLLQKQDLIFYDKIFSSNLNREVMRISMSLTLSEYKEKILFRPYNGKLSLSNWILLFELGPLAKGDVIKIRNIGKLIELIPSNLREETTLVLSNKTNVIEEFSLTSLPNTKILEIEDYFDNANLSIITDGEVFEEYRSWVESISNPDLFEETEVYLNNNNHISFIEDTYEGLTQIYSPAEMSKFWEDEFV